MKEILIFLFFVFSFCPYFQILPIPATTQPNALIVGCVLILMLKDFKFHPLVYYLFFLLFCSTLALFIEGFNTFSIKDWGNYLSLSLCTAVGTKLINENEKNFYSIFYIFSWGWFFIALMQYFVDPTFFSTFIYRMSGSFSRGRGAASMSSEPTYYGLMMGAMFSIYLAKEWYKKSMFLGFFLLFQLVVLSRSATTLLVFCVAILITVLYSLINLNVKGVIYSIGFMFVIGLISLFFIDELSDTRLGAAIDSFRSNYILILATDYAIAERLNHIVLPVLSLSDNHLIPQGFGTFGDYFLEKRSDPYFKVLFSHPLFLGPPARILSGYGKLFFEMGGFGLLLPIGFFFSVRAKIKNNYSYLFSFILFNGLLFMAFPFMTSIVPLGIAVFLTSRNELS